MLSIDEFNVKCEQRIVLFENYDYISLTKLEE